MYRYATLNEEEVVIGISELSGKVDSPGMILLSESEKFVSLGWRRVGGNWVEPLPTLPEPSSGVTLEEIKEMQLSLMESMAEIYQVVTASTVSR